MSTKASDQFDGSPCTLVIKTLMNRNYLDIECFILAKEKYPSRISNKMTGTVCVAGGETVVGDGDGSGGGDKKTGGHLSEAESEKSWKLIVLPGIERVFAFQVRVESRGATSNVFSSQPRSNSNVNPQESEGGRGDSRRLVSGPSVVSASSYDSDAVSTESSSSIGIDEGDDVRVACAMIVRKQVCNVSDSDSELC